MSGTWTAQKTWTASTLTVSDMNQYVRDTQEYLKTHISLEAAGALTITGGAITITQAYHKLSGQGAAADDLDGINGGSEGMVIILRADGEVITLKDGVENLVLGNDIVLASDDDHIALICDDAGDWHPLFRAITRTFMVNAFQYPNPGTDWTPTITGAFLDANLAAKKCWLPLNFLKIGDVITTYNLVGDAIEAAALTLDCKLVKVNKADPLTTTDITNGGITQIDADGDFDSSASVDDETVATDKQYLLEIEGTTGAGDSIYVMGAEVSVLRLL